MIVPQPPKRPWLRKRRDRDDAGSAAVRLVTLVAAIGVILAAITELPRRDTSEQPQTDISQCTYLDQQVHSDTHWYAAWICPGNRIYIRRAP